MTRADRHNNPTAFTTAVATQAGLIHGKEWTLGSPFPVASGATLYTAHLVGDPIALTVRVIDKLGFVTAAGLLRWSYIEFPRFVWLTLTPQQKLDTIGYMYKREGGDALRHLFPNYDKV